MYSHVRPFMNELYYQIQHEAGDIISHSEFMSIFGFWDFSIFGMLSIILSISASIGLILMIVNLIRFAADIKKNPTV
jgi:hypothetical protein